MYGQNVFDSQAQWRPLVEAAMNGDPLLQEFGQYIHEIAFGFLREKGNMPFGTGFATNHNIGSCRYYFFDYLLHENRYKKMAEILSRHPNEKFRFSADDIKWFLDKQKLYAQTLISGASSRDTGPSKVDIWFDDLEYLLPYQLRNLFAHRKTRLSMRDVVTHGIYFLMVGFGTAKK
jgi:hypothetical protein